MNADDRERAGRALDRAEVALHAHMPAQALAELRDALTLVPDLPEARLLQARSLLKQQQPKLALAALDVHDMYAPERRGDYAVCMLRIEALVGAGQPARALELTRRVLSDWPEDTALHRTAAGLAWHLGAVEAAGESLKRVHALEPGDDAATRLLSQLQEQANPQAGLAWLTDQMVRGSEPSLLLRAARLCRQAGRLRDAAARYARLVESQPEQAIVWREAGEVADELGEMKCALTRLHEAVRLGGRDYAASLRALARAQMHGGLFEPAAWHWWQRVRAIGEDVEAWAGLVVCAHAAGRDRLADRAHARLRQCGDSLARQHALAEQWQQFAVTRVCRDAPAAATSPLTELLQRSARVLKEATQAHPGRADAHYHHARCLAGLGSRSNATVVVDQALAINPKYRAAHELKAELAA